MQEKEEQWWQKQWEEAKAVNLECLAMEQWRLGMHSLLTGCAGNHAFLFRMNPTEGCKMFSVGSYARSDSGHNETSEFFITCLGASQDVDLEP